MNSQDWHKNNEGCVFFTRARSTKFTELATLVSQRVLMGVRIGQYIVECKTLSMAGRLVRSGRSNLDGMTMGAQPSPGLAMVPTLCQAVNLT